VRREDDSSDKYYDILVYDRPLTDGEVSDYELDEIKEKHAMAKTKTSTAVKRRYNEKVYTKIQAQLPKDLVAQFKSKCEEVGVSQASIFKEAMEKFIAEH
jgi:hypothetical protein